MEPVSMNAKTISSRECELKGVKPGHAAFLLRRRAVILMSTITCCAIGFGNTAATQASHFLEKVR